MYTYTYVKYTPHLCIMYIDYYLFITPKKLIQNHKLEMKIT